MQWQAARLPAGLAPVVLRQPRDEIEEAPEPSKRRLLSFIAPFATQVVAADGRAPSPNSKRRARNVRRLATALEAIAERNHRHDQLEALPNATVSALCDGCGVCASLCPTPALALRDANDGARELSFEGAECVQCLRCQSICPQQAIAVAPYGSGGERKVVRTLRLVKLALAIGAGSEGAVHSHVRRGLDEGLTRAELRHAAILAIATLGLPRAIAALTWIEDLVGKD